MSIGSIVIIEHRVMAKVLSVSGNRITVRYVVTGTVTTVTINQITKGN